VAGVVDGHDAAGGRGGVWRVSPFASGAFNCSIISVSDILLDKLAGFGLL